MLIVKIQTALSLGLLNLWKVFRYKAGIRFRINRVCRIKANIIEGDFFTAPTTKTNRVLAVSHQWSNNQHSYFSWYNIKETFVPNWHRNPFNGREFETPMRPWWLISDFDNKIGDIKAVWEPSRFDWVVILTQHALNGDEVALQKLNTWMSDWVKLNPPYLGPNWKCGQEASIRVMHIALAITLFNQQQDTSASLQSLLEAHLQRIAPTIQYAIAQNNNHGTSEAAALFVGGSLLFSLGLSKAKAWYLIGRKWLEDRSDKLIEQDGSFSQYSVNYHRMLLDTYSLAEYWRRKLGLPVFSHRLNNKLKSATYWLYSMVQQKTGGVPNLGANDGARLLPLDNCEYRDFRSSIQLAMVLFCKKNAFSDNGTWNIPLQWLGIKVPAKMAKPPSSVQFKDGGYSLLRSSNCFVLLRYPRFRFRPSQADVLHVDFWLDGINLLRDGGSYSYNAGGEVSEYFGGTASHNTIQFDNRDQMPRISRFLFGAWISTDDVKPIKEVKGEISTSASYIDYQGASHQRKVALLDSCVRIEDDITGFKERAVLRWRLKPGAWVLEGSTVRLNGHTLSITSSMPIRSIKIADGSESLHYMKKDPLPVLEIEVLQPGAITSEYRWVN